MGAGGAREVRYASCTEFPLVINYTTLQHVFAIPGRGMKLRTIEHF